MVLAGEGGNMYGSWGPFGDLHMIMDVGCFGKSDRHHWKAIVIFWKKDFECGSLNEQKRRGQREVFILRICLCASSQHVFNGIPIYE